MAGIERNGRLSIVGAAGVGAPELLEVECPTRTTIASTVLEGGKEFVLPYESGYLKEKPLLFHNDGIKAKQYFGFPLMMDEKPFGFLGFVSLSLRPLREGSITSLADTAVLMSLFLARLRVKEETEARTNRDPATGALRFRAFFDGLGEMAQQKKGFSVVSVKLLGFGLYNRNFGVARGDEILRKMHQSIEYCAGKGAIITRSEGAHFYVAITGSDGLEESQNILNILRFTILGALATAKKDVEVGTAHFPRDGEDLWQLFQIAEDRGRRNSI